jgi:hypothetical protein
MYRLVDPRTIWTLLLLPIDSNLVARETKSSLLFSTSWYMMIAVHSSRFNFARRWRVRYVGVYGSICSSKVVSSITNAYIVCLSAYLAVLYATVVLRLRFIGSSTTLSTKDLKSS